MSLIHILDKQTDEIIGTLNIGEYTDSGSDEGLIRSLENNNTFDFTALKNHDILQKRNRLILKDKDGFFSEFIIEHAEQFSRTEKKVRSSASFIDLRKAKIIEPQTLEGATAESALDFGLLGTEWRKGRVDFNGIRTIHIEEYTNPYSFLKKIASEFGLILRFRIAIENGNQIIRYVDLTLPNEDFSGKEVVFGKDMVDLRRIEDAQNIVTALLVLGPEIEDGTRLTVLVEDADALQRWGRNGQHLIDVYEPEITADNITVDRLRTLGENELQKRIDAIVTYECQAAVLEHIPGKEHEKVRLDYKIRIKDEGYTPPLYLEAKVLEIKEQPSTGKILDFKLGNYKEFSKADLEAQIAGLKKQLNDKLSKLVQVSVTSSAGTVFKNGTGETDLTAVTILGGKEVDTDGLFYNYVWSKYDKNGNFVGATSGKKITVYARNIDEKETYIVTVENGGAKSIGQITVTNVNDGEQGPPGPKGDDGKTTYTWRKYADDANGTNMSDNPEGKQYLGMAFNKETPIASMNPQDYSWSAMYDTEKIEETKEIANNAIDIANKAKQDAQNALSTADGKNTLFYQATAPSTVGRKIGDVWFNTADSHKMHRFDGSNWIPAQFGTNAIANLAITNALIANGAIGNAQISNLDAGKITTGYLNAARIAAKSIDVSKLNVSTLSAITANLGNITAGNISGVNITGSTFTAVGSSNASVNIDSNGWYVKDETGKVKICVTTKETDFAVRQPSAIQFFNLAGHIAGYVGMYSEQDIMSLYSETRLIITAPEIKIGGYEITFDGDGGKFRILANNIQSAVWWDNNVVCGWSYWQTAWWRFNWNTKSFEATNYAGTAYFPITASGWNTSSKAELKTDIKKWEESALEKIRNTTIYEYRLKEDESRTIRQGVVIGEGYQLDPSLVDKDETIDQYRMNSWSFKAIQELDSEQQGIKDRVAWLETENSYLKQKIKLLEEKIV